MGAEAVDDSYSGLLRPVSPIVCMVGGGSIAHERPPSVSRQCNFYCGQDHAGLSI